MGCVHSGESRESEAQDRSNLAGTVALLVLSQCVFIGPKQVRSVPLLRQLASKGEEVDNLVD
jgi:hypothetical protein